MNELSAALFQIMKAGFLNSANNELTHKSLRFLNAITHNLSTVWTGRYC